MATDSDQFDALANLRDPVHGAEARDEAGRLAAAAAVDALRSWARREHGTGDAVQVSDGAARRIAQWRSEQGAVQVSAQSWLQARDAVDRTGNEPPQASEPHDVTEPSA